MNALPTAPFTASLPRIQGADATPPVDDQLRNPHEAVIFDMDGVVTDTAAVHAAARDRVAARLDRPTVESRLALPRAGVVEVFGGAGEHHAGAELRGGDQEANEGDTAPVAARRTGRCGSGHWNLAIAGGKKVQPRSSNVAARYSPRGFRN